MKTLGLYAQLTKVDVAAKRAFGVITSEVPDRSNEICDYETSKPHFVEWSASIAKATDGKSLGNVREMHNKQAVGRVVNIDFDDAQKTIAVEAEIVDSSTWEKIEKGVLTGFSIGGRYIKRWPDTSNPVLKRYTCEPSEVSVVDFPANKDAFFDVVKADGVVEQRHFESPVDVDALEKTIAELSEADQDALLEKIARRKGVDPKEGKDKYGNVKYADPKNKKYPIDTPNHIRAAWNYIHMPRNAAKYSAEDVKTIKSRIVAAWKEKIDKAGPPEAEKFAESTLQRILDNPAAYPLAKAASEIIGAEIVEKGLWAVAQFAGLLEQLAAIADGTVLEAQAEGDDSTLPETMRAALKPIAAAFLQMAEEETDEALHGELNDDAAIAAMFNVIGPDAVAKRGRRHSKKTRERYSAIKDHAKAIVGHCEDLEGEDNDGANKAAIDELNKRADATDQLCKLLDVTPDALIEKLNKFVSEYIELRKGYDTWKDQLAKTTTSIRAIPVAKEADDTNNQSESDPDVSKLEGDALTKALMQKSLAKGIRIVR